MGSFSFEYALLEDLDIRGGRGAMPSTGKCVVVADKAGRFLCSSTGKWRTTTVPFLEALCDALPTMKMMTRCEPYWDEEVSESILSKAGKLTSYKGRVYSIQSRSRARQRSSKEVKLANATRRK